LNKSEFKKYLAMPTPIFVNEINKIYNLKVTVDELHSFTRSEFLRLIKNKYIPNPGIEKLLKELKKNRIQVAIASANRRKLILFDLNKLGLKKYFKTIVSVEDKKNLNQHQIHTFLQQEN
jgi:beta-phosphoglucomutase-like phosphatase (HAD superfamily)